MAHKETTPITRPVTQPETREQEDDNDNPQFEDFRQFRRMMEAKDRRGKNKCRDCATIKTKGTNEPNITKIATTQSIFKLEARNFAW